MSTSKTLDAGELRDRITIQSQITTVNSFGESVTEWEDYALRWAQIVDLSGNALLLAQQIQSEVRTRIVVRFDPAIRESMRVLWDGFVFDIKSVQRDPDTGREWLTMMCSRGLSAG